MNQVDRARAAADTPTGDNRPSRRPRGEAPTGPAGAVPSAPGRVGQGTAVEQSRAAAEVLAAVEVAQRFPRDPQHARAQMRDSCQQPFLAERAFYRFPRSGETLTGPSIHLARELARCWGHVQYGIAELRRDDEYGQSEMQAWAWDVQTSTRVSTTFIVPHKRDTKGGPKRLAELRDVYENNANNGARRVREMIFAVLPPWLVEEAKNLCDQTLRDGGGVPLPTRITNCVERFAAAGITREQLETKVGRWSADWTEQDVAHLGVIYTSIQRGEMRAADEFAPPAATADDIRAARGGPAEPASSASSAPPGPDGAEPEPDPRDDPNADPVTGQADDAAAGDGGAQ